MLKFSRRTECQVSRWARRYCDIISNPKQTLDEAKNSSRGRYAAVNLKNTFTVELRIFRGTLKYCTFIAALQFTEVLCNTTVLFDDEEFQCMSWLDFVKSVPSEYRELIEYLKIRNLYINEPVLAEEDI